jgi:tRNA (5-methylaminomethyl-2-thiouridylate)-methyltransferase
LEATDTFKDQTFFLSQVPEKYLRKTMFPVGEYSKHRVKEMASEIGLPKISKKKESTGICFIGDRTFQDFISEYIDVKPGNFVDINSGKIVGQHLGIHNWTLGQRAKIGGQKKPYFVCRKDVESSTIYVAAGTNHPSLYSDMLYTQDPHWINDSPFKDGNYLICSFRFQHTKPLTKCLIYKANEAGNRLILKLEKPLRSMTPGQFAVFYKDGECLGSSRILEAGPSRNFIGREFCTF